jgi:hypothetical protein
MRGNYFETDMYPSSSHSGAATWNNSLPCACNPAWMVVELTALMVLNGLDEVEGPTNPKHNGNNPAVPTVQSQMYECITMIFYIVCTCLARSQHRQRLVVPAPYHATPLVSRPLPACPKYFPPAQKSSFLPSHPGRGSIFTLEALSL